MCGGRSRHGRDLRARVLSLSNKRGDPLDHPAIPALEKITIAHYRDVREPRLFFLKDFQCKRLQTTYADFACQKKYSLACSFFFTRLYSTEDTSDRDQAFRKIRELIHRYLGGEVAHSMDLLVELQELTISLDETLIELLLAENADVEFDNPTYERLYRECDNYCQRLRQIELLVLANRIIHKISHRLGIGLVLQALRGACMVVGNTRMVDFLLDGYRAFKSLRKVEPLVEAIDTRETLRLERIYASADFVEGEAW